MATEFFGTIFIFFVGLLGSLVIFGIISDFSKRCNESKIEWAVEHGYMEYDRKTGDLIVLDNKIENLIKMEK